jgi:hypothetical protein
MPRHATINKEILKKKMKILKLNIPRLKKFRKIKAEFALRLKVPNTEVKVVNVAK